MVGSPHEQAKYTPAKKAFSLAPPPSPRLPFRSISFQPPPRPPGCFLACPILSLVVFYRVQAELLLLGQASKQQKLRKNWATLPDRPHPCQRTMTSLMMLAGSIGLGFRRPSQVGTLIHTLNVFLWRGEAHQEEQGISPLQFVQVPR